MAFFVNCRKKPSSRIERDGDEAQHPVAEGLRLGEIGFGRLAEPWHVIGPAVRSVEREGPPSRQGRPRADRRPILVAFLEVRLEAGVLVDACFIQPRR